MPMETFVFKVRKNTHVEGHYIIIKHTNNEGISFELIPISYGYCSVM